MPPESMNYLKEALCFAVLLLVMVMALLALPGCDQPSLNMQRAGLRDVGDAGATVWLEEIDESKVDKRRVQIHDSCGKIIEFLETGQVASLTSSVLAQKLVDLVPDEYKWLPADVLAAVSLAKTSNEIVGNNNIKRMIAFCRGMQRGAELYAIEDRSND